MQAHNREEGVHNISVVCICTSENTFHSISAHCCCTLRLLLELSGLFGCPNEMVTTQCRPAWAVPGGSPPMDKLDMLHTQTAFSIRNVSSLLQDCRTTIRQCSRRTETICNIQQLTCQHLTCNPSRIALSREFEVGSLLCGEENQIPLLILG